MIEDKQENTSYENKNCCKNAVNIVVINIIWGFLIYKHRQKLN